ncbi:FUSC family protein [Hyphomicrobium sp.]|uniref:FUSC family protein n=1 Tax=Hyphomicrobium sp. TaxID=82 RepID=UPI002D78E029|nr:FUSC family protein [Hyphomicrobium sp.]HET6389798.1 FUSC family protein [Hyphomicrobium sp.]
MTAAANRLPIAFAGFPLAAWAFAIRTWASMVLALYVAFWLQLESPSTAALTVAVLAFPWRGQGLEKAAYRVLATIVGLIASIVIVGLFAQTGWLLIAVLAAWIGICVYASSLLDGFRSYAAVLGIITVCLVAIEPLDTPQTVFDLAHERGAGILIGILSVMFVNDILFAPDYFPEIAARLQALQAKVAALAGSALRGVSISPEAAVALLRDITALRPEISSLSTETSIGPARGAAARTAMVDLVAELQASRSLAALTGSPNSASRVSSLALDWLSSELRQSGRDVEASIEALRDGTAPRDPHRAPLYRSRRIALANAVRASVYFVLGAVALAILGWPSTSVALAFVGILIGLSAMSPNQNAATVLAFVAVPVGCLFAGILEFVVLDGVTDFPLLAIGLLPFTVLCALIMSIPNPASVSLGRALLVFTIAVFSPSNPQAYNPQSFLFACVFLGTAAVLLFICQLFLPPLSDEQKLKILLTEARQDAVPAVLAKHGQHGRHDAMFREAVRMSQIVAAAGEEAPLIKKALGYFDGAAALRLAAAALEMLPEDLSGDLRERAAFAVAEGDGQAILAVSDAIISSATDNSRSIDDAVAALAAAGELLALAAPKKEDAP